jgi:DNA mismatch repair protein MutL
VRFVRATLVHDTVRDAVRVAIGAAKAAATPLAPLAPVSPSGFSIPKPPAAPATHDAAPAEAAVRAEDARLSREEMLAALYAGQPFAAPLSAPELEPSPAPNGPPPAPPEQRKINLRPESWAAEDDIAAESRLENYAPPSGHEAGHETSPATPVRYGTRIGCLGTRGPEDKNSPLKPATDLSLSADEINPLGQLHSSFIIAVDRNGFLLIDQHVAHERILFEQHWRALRGKRVEVQRLLLPETVDLSPAQAAAFDQLLPELEENGFEIGQLSGRTVAVKSVPAALPPGAARSLLVSLLDAVEPERRGLTMDELRAEVAAGLACRAAIKINMSLAPEKMRWLVDELLKTENPATCPHGRPIILRITAREIERAFQRS